MKNILKKELAILMAALMLMTAWVFVAPEKAEAVNSSGSYSWSATVYNGNSTYSMDTTSATLYVLVYQNNGYGSRVSADAVSWSSSSLGTKSTRSLGGSTSAGFPVGLTGSIKNNNGTQSGELTYTFKSNGFEASKYKDLSAGSSWNLSDTVIGQQTSDGKWPHATNIVYDLDPSGMTAAKTGATDASMSFRTHVEDQYGVRMSSAAYSVSNTLSISEGNTTGLSVSSSNSNAAYDVNTVKASSSAQYNSSTVYQRTVTVKTKYTDNAGWAQEASKTFTLTDPNYTFTLNNGTTDSTASLVQPSSATTTKRYYYKFGTNPEARRAGYTYFGHYLGTKSGNTWSNQNSDNYSWDSTSWVPTGTKLTANTLVTADNTYYATWRAKDVTVTFVDSTGTVLGTGTAKYDQPINSTYYTGYDYNAGVPYHTAPGETGTYDMSFAGWVVDGAKQYNADGTQSEYNGYDGDKIIDRGMDLKGDVVLRPYYEQTKKEYSATFYNEAGNVLSNVTNYHYNDPITQPAGQTKAADNTYTYTFKGWRAFDKAGFNLADHVNSEGKYAILVDEGTTPGVAEDFNIKYNVVYLPVFSRTYIPYTVTFADEGTQDTIYTNKHYGEKVEIPATVESYTNSGYRYNATGWSPELPTISTETDEEGVQHKYITVTGNATYTMGYGEGIPAIYTIRFFDYDGTQLNEGEDQFAHGTNIYSSIPTPTLTYRDSENEYTWSGEYKDANGNMMTSSIAGADVDWFANYDSAKLYDVKFYDEDGGLQDTIQQVAGAAVPFTEKTEEFAKADDNEATDYTFSKWVIKGTGAGLPNVMPESDLELEPVYTSTPIEYTVNFNYSYKDGEEIKVGTITRTGRWGDDLVAPVNVETVADEENEFPDSYADNTYTYTFRSWDKAVSDKIGSGIAWAEGADKNHKTADITALYRKGYVYYEVNWKNADGSTLKTENYIYNSNLTPPYATPEMEAPTSGDHADDPNYTWLFKEWKYVDGPKAGEAYTRGDKVQQALTLEASYDWAPAVKKVTFVDENGTTLVVRDVAYGTALKDANAPSATKAPTDEEHYDFDAWLKNDGTVFGDNDVITDNITLKASYKAEAHGFEFFQFKDAPTFWEKGTAEWVCDHCEKSKIVEVDELLDTVPPTNAIFVKDNAWREVYDADLQKATSVALTNFVTVASADKANVDENYNKTGEGSGIGSVAYAVVKNSSELDTDNLASISYTTLYTVPEDKAEVVDYSEDFNFTGRISDLDGLDKTDGEQFYIVTKVTDKLGNPNYTFTGLLELDTTAPVIEITSDFQSGSKHCIDATISITEAVGVASVKVDGEEISANTDGTYSYSKTGLHQIVVSDIAGNVTRQNFEIIGNHNGRAVTVNPTCTEAGSTKTVCTLCGKTIGEETVIPATGHTEATRKIEATCTEAGTIITYCTVCGAEIKTEEDPDAPAKGHSYTEYYRLDATCSAEGLLEEVCTECGEIKSTTLDIDPNAHSYYRAKTEKPTCTEGGITTQTCKYCGKVNTLAQGRDPEGENYDANLAPTGHVATGKWVVTEEPGCVTKGTQVQYCKYHDTIVVETEEIPALGHSYRAEVIEPGAGTQGYTRYTCEVCGDTYDADYTDALEEFTVTFKVGDSTTEIKRYKGETITALDEDYTAINTDKEADTDNKYVFSGWKDVENEQDFAMPITVERDVTLTAQYEAKPINYTITLHKEDIEQIFFKVGYNKNGQEVDLSDYTLTKASDDQYDYEFAGWSTDIGASEGSFTYTINGADVDLYPAFSKVERNYTVVFAIDNMSDALATVTVRAGGTAEYPTDDEHQALLVKAWDNNAHYTFKGWSKSLENIMADTIVYAQFDAHAHTATEKVADKSRAASCTESGVDVFKCTFDGCGYETSTAIPAFGHSYEGEPTEIDGKLGWICSTCGEFVEDTKTYTVRFFDEKGEDGTAKLISTVAYQPYGTDIGNKIPADPTKDSDGEYVYTFAGWVDEDGNAVEFSKNAEGSYVYVVKANANFYATYTSKKLAYVVRYEDLDGTTLQVGEYEFGETVSFTGTEPGPRAEVNGSGHKDFVGWNAGNDNVDQSGNKTEGKDGVITVTGNVNILAVYSSKVQKHSYGEATVKTPATCTEDGVKASVCTICGFEKTETIKAAGHKGVLVSSVGLIDTYVCSECGETWTVEREDTTIVATIKIVDAEGSPVEGAKVSLYDGNTFINSGTTGSDGIVRLIVPEAKEYTIVVESQNGSFTDQTGKVNIDGNGNSSISGVNIPKQHCSCACHKGGIWGSIFRFFHKIIKLFTGKFNCCDNPDPRYYN